MKKKSLRMVKRWPEGRSTSLRGYFPRPTRYADLVKVFGEPGPGDGYKVDAEWMGYFGGKFFTIYNYKTGKNHNGPDGEATQDITTWHIGGGRAWSGDDDGGTDTDALIKFFESALAEKSGQIEPGRKEGVKFTAGPRKLSKEKGRMLYEALKLANIWMQNDPQAERGAYDVAKDVVKKALASAEGWV